MSDDETKRYDIMVIPSNTGYKAPVAAIRVLVQTLAFRGFGTPVDEAVHKDWAEIYMEPGPAAHEMFIKHGYDGPQPVFHEMMVRGGTEPVVAEYGPVGREVYLMIEVRGCVFEAPAGPFRKMLHEGTLNMRVSTFKREFTELPPHREVDPEDAPDDPRKKKKERGPGLAGVDVDEW